MTDGRDHHRNKYFLGEFTLEDLLKFVEVEGDFTVGRNWLPIVVHKVSRRRRTLQLFMDSVETDPEMEVPLDARVKVEGRIAVMRIGSHGYPSNTEVRIRFERDLGFP